MTECHKELQQLMDSTVSVVTNDGRTMFGTLKGLDQKLNVILEECKERVFSKEEGVEEVGAESCVRARAACTMRSGARAAGTRCRPAALLRVACAGGVRPAAAARCGCHRACLRPVLRADALRAPCRCR